MVKKDGSINKKFNDEDLQKALIENFISLQKVLTNLSVKFDELSSNISKLLQLFEISAKSFTEKYSSGDFGKQSQADQEFLKKLDSLLDQNKTISKAILLMEEKISKRSCYIIFDKMELKHPNAESRIIFLKKFTEELIISFLEEEQIKKEIKIEKLRKEFIEPNISPEQAFRKIIRTPVVPAHISEKKEIKQAIFKNVLPKKTEKKLYANPLIQRMVINKYPNKLSLNKEKSILMYQPFSIYPKEPSPLQTFELESQQRPEGFNLGKVDLLLKDPLIKIIECEGPDKELIIKKNGRMYTTKIIMNPAEIKEVLDSFSKEARIPVIIGVFKAVVGDLMISALVSDVVGSKFIITKMSQYSLLKQK